MVAPARIATDGTAGSGGFRSVTQQKIVQDRRDVWFQTALRRPDDRGLRRLLQRALKARGLYRAPVTGVMDTATAEAVRQYQAERGSTAGAVAGGGARSRHRADGPLEHPGMRKGRPLARTPLRCRV